VSELLPLFRYHHDPLATGVVAVSDAICECCCKARGYVVQSGIYSAQTIENLCPWCVSDGSAAKRFSGEFVQDIDGKVPQSVYEEIMHRTPGYISWQGECWLTHCDDACVFHGDLTREELRTLPVKAEKEFLERNGWVAAWWPELKEDYEPAGDTALYKFVCRHCSQWIIGIDMS
jgi:uncharacterized protein